ncbi:endonuclease/exonuclease/phosphatase family protein [Nocardioides litoris]|uniref:endonuclease/exonuclease/phosphatase family protein n=1 Tax=Nocardioides litoris TaxID=1926648 RepID=UPI00111D990C|nr:endonuclease/exonuclease/phosphatase family protein [Nocardioides litoris]
MTRARLLLLGLAGLLVLGSLPVTLSRLTGWTSAPGIVLTAFAPLALVSYAAALVLVLAAVVAGRRGGRLALAVAALAVVPLLLHVAWAAPLMTDEAEEPTGPDRVTLMSVNALLGRADAEVVADLVRERDVDVLVVSEVTPAFLRRAEAAGLRDVLPVQAGRPGTAAEGTMVFSRAPLEVVATVPTRFDSLVVRTSGLTVLGTHPAPPTAPDEWRRDLPLVLDAAVEHDVDAIVGDLNATLDHAPVRDLVDGGWRDAVELTGGGFQPTWPAGGGMGLPFAAVQIDHVLVGERWTVTAVDDQAVPDTDHHAVTATLAPAG